MLSCASIPVGNAAQCKDAKAIVSINFPPLKNLMQSISAKSRFYIGLSRFPLDTLPGFVAAANSLSFTQAAADLQLTQSAISKQVKALEEAVGHSLFKWTTSAGGRLEMLKPHYFESIETMAARSR